MSRMRDQLPASALVSVLAALTTWVTLLAWTSFAERPGGFMFPLLVACVLVAIVGTLLRAMRVVAPWVLLAQVVVLGLWLVNQYARAVAPFGMLPSPEAVRAVVETVRRGDVAAQTFSSPVPASVPEFYPLLVVAGCGAVLAVDFLAAGLRRAPLAGLPLLAVYTAPVSVLDGGVSWLKFAAAALCFVFLVAAEQGRRLSGWGVDLTTGPGHLDEDKASLLGGTAWASARRIGVTATALAVVVPVLVPTFSASVFAGSGGGGSGGGGAVNISNPLVNLRRDLNRGADVELLEVTTANPDPSYLRISVLDSFDGSAWRPSGRDIPKSQRADGAVPDAPGLSASVPRTSYRTRIDVSSRFASRWLPTPYPVSSVRAPGDWRYDTSTMDFVSAADGQTTAGLSYQARALNLSPTVRELTDTTATPPSVLTPNTRLPSSFPDSVRRLAEQVTRGESSRFEQAVALQQWFRVGGGFRYSLERAPGNGTDDLVRFLRKGDGGRVGYCEQFAAAMAVMGRSLGIPSRVAVGFLHPDQIRNDTWVYSSHDLHAWPEMYFGGVGWVRFEPTPADRTGGVPSYTTARVPQAAPTTGVTPSSSASPSASPTQKRISDAVASSSSTPGGGSSGPAAEVLVWTAAVVVLVLLLLAPRLLRSWRRRRRWSTARTSSGAGGLVEAGWAELRDTALDLGVSWDEGPTLRQAAAALQPRLRAGGGQELHRLVDLVERARYARSLPRDAARPDDVRRDVAALQGHLRAGVSPSQRFLATWLPRSLLRLNPAPSRVSPSGRLDTGVDRAV